MTVESDIWTQAIDDMSRWHDYPVEFVREAFGAEPDPWQLEALEAVAREPRVAMKACKGPGKSCVLAWTIWWFLSTRIDAQILVLSITKDNLKDNLWKELAYWYHKSEFLQRSFTLSAERIKSREHPETWWVSARAFSQSADKEQQANTLAGMHAEHVMIVLDEVGDYPMGVVAAAEGIFANPVEAKLVAAGNPTNVNGPLFFIVTRDASRWYCITITGDPDDPNRSPRISLEWALEQIAKYGRDNPWVMVNVLGLFPPVGANQLIGPNDVDLAQRRDANPMHFRSDAVVWGIDPAHLGDDCSVLVRRQGIVSFRPHVWRGLDGPKLADQIAIKLRRVEGGPDYPDAVFIDRGGVGASCYDQLMRLGYGHVVMGIDFGWAADDPSRFADKRSEMWWQMADWTKKQPSCLPTDPELAAEMTAPTFEIDVRNRQTVFILESKKKMRARGIGSPDRADALALTFAGPVAPRSKGFYERQMGAGRAVTERVHVSTQAGGDASAGRALADYNPT